MVVLAVVDGLVVLGTLVLVIGGCAHMRGVWRFGRYLRLGWTSRARLIVRGTVKVSGQVQLQGKANVYVESKNLGHSEC